MTQKGRYSGHTEPDSRLNTAHSLPTPGLTFFPTSVKNGKALNKINQENLPRIAVNIYFKREEFMSRQLSGSPDVWESKMSLASPT